MKGNKMAQVQPMFTSARRSWETEATGYSVRHFYVKSRDSSKYEPQVIRVKFPPDTWDAVSAVVQAEEFPYKSPHDFLRDAVVHRMEFLRRNAGIPLPSERWLRVEFAQAKVDQAGREIDANRRLVDTAKLQLEEAAEVGDRVLLRELLTELESVAESMREPYKSAMEKLLHQSWR